MDKISLFHLDDDELQLEGLKRRLTSDSNRFTVTSFSKEADLIDALHKRTPPDLLVLDIHLSHGKKIEGVHLIQRVKKVAPATQIIMYSNDLSTIRLAMTEGADDFISKSSSAEEIHVRLTNFAARRQQNLDHKKNDAIELNVIGASMQAVAKRVEKLLQSAVRNVHVTGETGTGKEVVAHIFETLLGKSAPLLRINCAAISPSLVESELFGHVKGAFTGALTDKKGYLEAADNGWLFLDEVDSLSLSTQAALLRVIENQEVMRVGSNKTLSINVKIISATHQNLAECVEKNLFRNDLRQRLSEVVIKLPPLRERSHEVAEFIEYFCRTERGGPYKISSEVATILSSLSWEQSNVRGLRNVIRAMTENHLNKTLTLHAIPQEIWAHLGSTELAGGNKSSVKPENLSTLTLLLPDGQEFPSYDRLCDSLLVECIRMVHMRLGKSSLGSIATALGMPKSTLVSRIKKLESAKLLETDEIKTLLNQKAS